MEEVQTECCSDKCKSSDDDDDDWLFKFESEGKYRDKTLWHPFIRVAKLAAEAIFLVLVLDELDTSGISQKRGSREGSASTHSKSYAFPGGFESIGDKEL